ncbi:S4 domain-containing protein [Buchnera aphidicola]|uniref:S4 domain-containing protein n=1 Tax=Buchnera aphidicola TaxID=9 RepID=UPI0012AB9471|nr:S4 domain-containing protein [Buchnera aphidicola]
MNNKAKFNFIVPNLKLQSYRLDKILVKLTSSVSRSCIKKWILSGYVTVNNNITTIPKKKFFLKTKFLLI